jgi:hypothetical protein
MERAGMVPLHKQVWGSKGGMWSWENTSGSKSWIDWLYVSEGMVKGIQQMGVTKDVVPGSDHRGYLLDINTEVLLGGVRIMGVKAANWRAGERRTRILDGHKECHIQHFLQGLDEHDAGGSALRERVAVMEEEMLTWAQMEPSMRASTRQERAVELGLLFEQAVEQVVVAEAATAAQYEGMRGSRAVKQWGSGGWSPRMVGLDKCLHQMKLMHGWSLRWGGEL